MSLFAFSSSSSKTTTKLESSSSNTNNNNDTTRPPLLLCQYHEPPKNTDYSQNPSIFGRILQGKAKARVYLESDNLLAFQDRSPKAEFHILVIPKRYIPTVYELDDSDDLALLSEMRDAAINLLQNHQPKALQQNDYRLCYHVPPFNSVHHLHLHVLAPVSKMGWYAKDLKYKTGTRWCIEEGELRTRLEQDDKPAVPFQKWWC